MPPLSVGHFPRERGNPLGLGIACEWAGLKPAPTASLAFASLTSHSIPPQQGVSRNGPYGWCASPLHTRLREYDGVLRE